MGDHYVPRYYLRGFGTQPAGDHITRFDKMGGKPLSTSISNVAHENDYYDPETEQYLANEIEGPANSVLKKIRKREHFNDGEKRALATYIAVMMLRVPSGKELTELLAPASLSKVFGEIEESLLAWQERDPARKDVVARRRAEAQELRQQYEKALPKWVWLDMLRRFGNGVTTDAISQMTWRVFVHQETSMFLTSDNPVFYTRQIGLGSPEAELTFPISGNSVLVATWRSGLGTGYMKADERIVAEANRRTASRSTRYVFFDREEPWIPRLLKKVHDYDRRVFARQKWRQ